MLDGKSSRIDDLLRTLECIDLDRFSLKHFTMRVENIYEVLQNEGFPESHSFYQRLDNVAEIIDSYFNGRRDYFGVLAGSTIRVVMNGRLIVTRAYGPNLKIKWRFNSQGRIDYIKHFGDNYCDKSLVEVLESEESSDWFIRNAMHKALPENSYLINPGIPQQHPKKQIQSVIRFGHGVLKEISQGKEIRDLELNSGQINLSEIYEDKEAIEIVDTGAVIFPTVIDYSKDTLVVRYRAG